ncbi:MAG: dihydropteroate synthase [Bacteroidales bacterium]|nr:dihydropteroate synthase [Bacteroidales bacterium]MDD2611623.1 dihydropteroate synthase [Bacteroidales bacterium]MDD3907419.1 dihydropteroate synthase [Bacteroidales bacterium]
MQFLGKSYSINIHGRLMDLGIPKVMGVLNVTPDSFFSSSRYMSEEGILYRVGQIIDEGADILDVGACSTKPGIELVSEEEELIRLRMALHLIRKRFPDFPISVDTFRARVSKAVVEEYDVDIINDISGGDMDPDMFETVAGLHVPYILMHMQGKTPADMQLNPHYEDMMSEIFQYLAKRVEKLRNLGVNDIILDPGFGFGKTVENNYEMLRRLNEFEIFDLPLLVGISRKSMIYKYLGTTPETSLNGTSVINTMALMGGAHILRVHDVKEAVECVKLVQICKKSGLCH